MREELVEVVRKLKDYDCLLSDYIDSIPRDINEAFFDNTYVNIQNKQNSLLLKTLFGTMSEDVEWFLYEFEAGKSPGPHCILSDGKEFTFNTNEDYYQYLKEHG